MKPQRKTKRANPGRLKRLVSMNVKEAKRIWKKSGAAMNSYQTIQGTIRYTPEEWEQIRDFVCRVINAKTDERAAKYARKEVEWDNMNPAIEFARRIRQIHANK